MGVSVESDREILGIWWQQTEGAKFWLAVRNGSAPARRRRRVDRLRRRVGRVPRGDRRGLPGARTQTCIVHLIRSSMRYVADRDRDRKRIAADLQAVYRAIDADHALAELQAFDAHGGASYPMMIAEAWRARWEPVTPFLALPEGCAARSTPPTASRASTARSARRSRPAARSPTNRPPPSSSTSPSTAPSAPGAAATPEQPRSAPSRSTSETDSPTNHTNRHPGPTHRRCGRSPRAQQSRLQRRHNHWASLMSVLLDVVGVDQHHIKPLLEHDPHRLRVIAGGLHRRIA